MGHATHFLQRLQRSTAAQAERALQLYNNPALVEQILDQLQLDDSVDRMVWSLDEKDQGPYLLLTREGGFVTCLAKNMAIEGLYFVRYSRLTALWEKAQTRLEKLENVREWQEQTGNSWQDLLALMTAKGDDLSREMFQRLVALQPVLRVQMLSQLLRRFEDLLQLQPSLTKSLQGSREASAELYRHYWNDVWSMSHLSTLLAHEGNAGLGELQEFFTLLQEQAPSEGPTEVLVLGQPTSLFWPSFRQGLVPIALRAIWGMGRLGKPLVTPLKHHLQSMDSFLTWNMAFLGLSCIALRHNKMQKEIAKTLSSHLTKPASIETLQQWNAPEGALAFTLAVVRGDTMPESQLQRQFQTTAMGMLEGQNLPEDYQFAQASDIPEDLACSLVTNASGNWLKEPDELMRMASLLPWLAQVEAPQLYLPETLIATLSAPWNINSVVELLETHQSFYGSGNSQTVRKEQRVGRNDPCPCGSGKKYKKCCIRSSS